MDELKNRTCEIRRENGSEISKPISPDVTKIDENVSENGDILLNLIAEIVVENIVRKLRDEYKKQN